MKKLKNPEKNDHCKFHDTAKKFQYLYVLTPVTFPIA